MKRLLTVALLGSIMAPVAIGCGEDSEVRRTVDCFQICQRFDECVTDIDITACTDDCEDISERDSDTRARADTCESCIDDATCAEAEPCWNDCPVVPRQD